MSHRNRTFWMLLGLASFAAFPVLGAEDGRFSVTVGTHDNLLITGPHGEPVADMVAPTLQKGVKLGDTTLQVSYGRDANGQLTAVLTPRNSDSGAIHFSAGGRSVDAEKAVVTLTFPSNLKGVLVDPGYVGTVTVDSHLLRARSLAEDQPVTLPAPVAVATPETALSTPEPTSAIASAPAPTPTPAPPTAAAIAALERSGDAGQPNDADPPAGGQHLRQTPPRPRKPQPDASKPVKLYWSEPVTAPDGTAPAIASDEIKLVELHGSVSVLRPDGQVQPGTEGMVVSSGSTIRTDSNSSVALFLGGVNSARMMPNCELVVTQTLANSIRTNVINLHQGAVFSRVGHRDGETENYTVSTPEGTTDAQTRDMLAYRGNPAQLRSAMAGTRTGLLLDSRHLLAWNPAPSHDFISDVAQSDLGILTPIGFIPDTYFYYTGGYKLSVNANVVKSEVLSNFSPNATTSDSEPDFVLQAILTTLQPYNVKLNQLLKAYNNGTETPAQLTYYNNLVALFFDKQAKGVVTDLLSHPNGFAHVLNVDSAMLWQDLREFTIAPLTPN